MSEKLVKKYQNSDKVQYILPLKPSGQGVGTPHIIYWEEASNLLTVDNKQ